MAHIRPIHNVYLSYNPKLAMEGSGHSISHYSIKYNKESKSKSGGVNSRTLITQIMHF
jgi:hypothetical protein